MRKVSKNIKAVILDLDDTLYDCTGSLLLEGRKRVAKIISTMVKCSREEAYHLQLEIERKHGTTVNVYETIAQYYNLPPDSVKVLQKEFARTDISSISPFPDVPDTLLQLRLLKFKLMLVTAGDKYMQKKKIETLGLHKGYFDEIHIVDKDTGQSKEEYFKLIMQKYNLRAEEIVSVGDKISDELAHGKSLGMVTVMFEHGRHYQAYTQEQERHFKPDFSIKCIKDLLKLIR